MSSATPVLGKLMRTSCGMDEVCLSDIIPELAEIYPNKQLEIILHTTEPPAVIISTGLTTLWFSRISKISFLLMLLTMFENFRFSLLNIGNFRI